METQGRDQPDLTIDREIGTRLRAAGLVREDEDVTVLHDRWLFLQAARGYRFGIDAVVLARRAGEILAARDAAHRPSVLDVGTGCGVVAILVASGSPAAGVTAVEIQPAQADRARRNVELNGLMGRVDVVEADLLQFASGQAGAFDLVVSNPPFYRAGSGRVNPDGERAIARHELRLDMTGLLWSVARLLAPSGLAVILYPAERLEECLAVAGRSGLSPVTIVPLLPAPGASAESYLIELVHAEPGVPAAPETAAPMYLNRDV